MAILRNTADTYRAGVNEGTAAAGGGNLFTALPSPVGLRRVADGFDPLAFLAPRESWGASAGAVAGWVDPQTAFVTANVAWDGDPLVATNYASTYNRVHSGGTDYLRVVQDYDWLPAPNDNVLQVAVRVRNRTASAQAVLYRRLIDWDLAPTPALNVSTFNARSGAVSASSDEGLTDPEHPSPLVAFNYSAPNPGTSAAKDAGAGIQLDFGTQTAGAEAEIGLFYAIARIDQSENQLRAQLFGLGCYYVASVRVSGASADLANGNTMSLGVGAVVFRRVTGSGSGSDGLPCASLLGRLVGAGLGRPVYAVERCLTTPGGGSGSGSPLLRHLARYLGKAPDGRAVYGYGCCGPSGSGSGSGGTSRRMARRVGRALGRDVYAYGCCDTLGLKTMSGSGVGSGGPPSRGSGSGNLLSGSESGGDQIQLPEPCNGCDVFPRRWRVVFSGVTNDTCTVCNVFNQEEILVWQGVDWRSLTLGGWPCSTGHDDQPRWILSCIGGVFPGLYLTAFNTTVQYRKLIPINCLSANVLSFDFDSQNQCNWPATLTLEPA